MKKSYAVLCLSFLLAGCSGHSAGTSTLANFDPAQYYSSVEPVESPACRNNLTMSGGLSQRCAKAAASAPAPLPTTTTTTTPGPQASAVIPAVYTR